MRYGLLNAGELDAISRIRTREATFFTAVNRQVRNFMKEAQGKDSISCPDSITMAIVLNGAVATDTMENFVDVDDGEGISRGATYVDDLGVLGRKPNANVVYVASERRFKSMLMSILNGHPV